MSAVASMDPTASPVDVVNRIIPQLIKGGRVPTPGIGIVAADESTAASLGADGVVVVRVVPGSPAEGAGLRGVDTATGTLGDVIVAADGQPVRTLADLTDELEKVGVGNEVELQINGGGSARTVKMKVADIGRTPS